MNRISVESSERRWGKSRSAARRWNASLALLGKARRVARAMATSPPDAWSWILARLEEGRENRRPPCVYEVDPDWERRLHHLLGTALPCPMAAEFPSVWRAVMRPFEMQGVDIGRGAFAGWGDGEPGLVRAAWCLVRHLRPRHVVETGVARGFTSRLVLEALERNGDGHLWSIDLPPPLHPDIHHQVGAAVGDGFAHRWTYIKGSSARRLPGLLAELGRIDLFIHDSRHTEKTVRFELDRAWSALRPGGALLVDDIDLNWGFHSFTQTFRGYPFLVCHAEPLRPDLPRVDGRGLFGIVIKQSLDEEPLAS